MSIDKLESFLESVWNKRLWVFAWGGFVYCAVFLFNSYFNLPQELDVIKKQEINSQLYIADRELVVSFYREIDNAGHAFVKASENFNELAPNLKQRRIPQPKIKEGLDLISNARRKLSSTIGAIKGTTFQTDLFADFFKGYDEDLSILEKFLELTSNFYLAYASGNKQEYIDKATVLVGYSPKLKELEKSLTERTESSQLRFSAIAEEVRIQEEENKGKIGIQRWRMLFGFLSLLYIELFLLAGFRAWRKHSRKSAKGLNRYDRSILKSLENYAEHTKSKKVWGLTSLAFVGSFWFVADLVATSPEKLAYIERAKARNELYSQDLKRIDTFQQKLSDWAVKNTETMTKLNRVFHSLSEKRIPDGKDFADGYISLMQLRQDSAYFFGTIRGTSFQSIIFSDLLNGLESALRDYDSMLEVIEESYVTIITFNKENFPKIAQSTSEMVAKSPAITNSLQSRILSIKQRLTAILKYLEVEVDKENAMVDRYLIRALFFFPATLYQVFFVIVAFRTWGKQRRKDLSLLAKSKRARRRGECKPDMAISKEKKERSLLASVTSRLLYWRARIRERKGNSP